MFAIAPFERPQAVLPRDSWSDGVSTLTDLVLAGDVDAAWVVVERARRASGSAIEVLSDLLGVAAAQLDALWRDDRASSMEVLMGLCRLRTLTLHLVGAAADESAPTLARLTAVTWSPRGDRLAFSSALHEACLELLGWHVEKYDGLPVRDVLERLRLGSVDLVLCTVEDPRMMESTCRGLRRFRETASSEVRFVGVGRAFDECVVPGNCPLTCVVRTMDETMHLARCAEAV